MDTFSGYRLIETVYEGKHTTVYRGQDADGPGTVILKVLKEAYPTTEQVAWLRQEYQLMEVLKGNEGISCVYDLKQHDRRWAIVMEDFGGQSLRQLGIAGKIALGDFLELAIQLCKALGIVHQAHMIHKDINPANAVLNPATKVVKLIDFGIATQLSREEPVVRNPNALEGTLAYLSPEQTGRMNRSLDYRSDFYSLGVTLYELLAGKRPFVDEDPLALIHAHLAQRPQPLHQLRPDVPEVVSEIILKLLSKNAEERYQSAYGLQADLTECLHQWQRSGQVNAFPLATHDVPPRLELSQRLYGREAELSRMLAAFEQSAAGASGLCLVMGAPGIGKTLLVQELYKPVTERRAYFVAGKYDTLQRNIPYLGFTQAFEALIRQLLSGSEAEVAAWRETLSAALGPNGQVITEVIPAVELLLGPQPEVAKLEREEAQNRFNLVFQNFVKVFARVEHPLVLFLDDLQYADGASLKLLEMLLTGLQDLPFLVVGTCRDEEIGASHPLRLMVARMQEQGKPVTEIEVKPLTLAHVSALIADSLRYTPDVVLPLAELVHTKTEGNPFFVNEFLRILYVEGALKLDARQGRYVWDLAQATQQQVTANVADLLIKKVEGLEPLTQKTLKTAACIGSRFDLQTLAATGEEGASEVARALWPALRERLIVPLGNEYRLAALEGMGPDVETDVTYKFAHDRIQHAIYSMLSDAERTAAHHKIGRYLMQHTSEAERGLQLFEMVNQLNLGRALTTAQAEQDELARLNLEAAQRANASTACETALNYAQTGIALLGDGGWERAYEVTLALYEEAVSAAHFNADHELMDSLTRTAFARARNAVDTAEMAAIRLVSLGKQQYKIREAVDEALVILKKLGVSLPSKPGMQDVLMGLLQVRLALNGKSMEALRDLPVMTDRQQMAAISIMRRSMSFSFGTNPNLFPLLVFEILKRSLKYGFHPWSTLGYGGYGMVMVSAMGDIETSYRFGRLALELAERTGDKAPLVEILFLFNGFIRHWKEPVRESVRALVEVAYPEALESGSVDHVGNTIHASSTFSCFTGEALGDISARIAGYQEVLQRFKLGPSLLFNELTQSYIDSLVLDRESPWVLGKDPAHEEAVRKDFETSGNQSGLCMFYVYKLALSCIYRQYEAGVSYIAAALKNESGGMGMPLIPVLYFYSALSCLGRYPDAAPTEQKTLLKQAEAGLKKLRKWAEFAPMNQAHRVALIEAELARVMGKPDAARGHYEAAIQKAQENGFINDAALACELAADFYRSLGQERLADYYLREASLAYERWGATAKVQALMRRYPFLQAQPVEDGMSALHTVRLMTTTTPTPTPTPTMSGKRMSGVLDMESVMRASHAISSETELDALLAKLITLLIQNAGAERGCLVLEQGQGLIIQAEGEAGRDPQVLQALPVAAQGKIGRLSPEIVQFVVRSKEPVVLGEATQEGGYGQTPYVKARRPKSILCVPLMNQNALVGAVYLENNLASNAFTAERVELVRLLGTQAAISLTNAQMTAKLRESMGLLEERNRQLQWEIAERARTEAERARLQAENARMEAELDVTRRLQQMLLPTPHELSQVEGLDIAGFMQPAEEVGGDYYDVLRHNDRIKIGIGDVTGHGLESGVVMLMAQTAVRTLLTNGVQDARQFMDVINRTLHDNIHRMNVDKSLSLALLDYQQGQMTLSGQHEKMIVMRRDGAMELVDTIDLGFPVGLEEGIAQFVTEKSIALEPGEGIVLYSDGVTEAENAQREFYGLERLCAVIHAHWMEPAEAIKQAVVEDVYAFIGQQRVYDDLTLVVVKQK